MLAGARLCLWLRSRLRGARATPLLRSYVLQDKAEAPAAEAPAAEAPAAAAAPAAPAEKAQPDLSAEWDQAVDWFKKGEMLNGKIIKSNAAGVNIRVGKLLVRVRKGALWRRRGSGERAAPASGRRRRFGAAVFGPSPTA